MRFEKWILIACVGALLGGTVYALVFHRLSFAGPAFGSNTLSSKCRTAPPNRCSGIGPGKVG
jgi:hypothetical protein